MPPKEGGGGEKKRQKIAADFKVKGTVLELCLVWGRKGGGGRECEDTLMGKKKNVCPRKYA